MAGKSHCSCYELGAILPVLLARVNRYKVFADQLFEPGLIIEKVTIPYQPANLKQFLSFCRRGRCLALHWAYRRGDEHECHSNDAGCSMQKPHCHNFSIRHFYSPSRWVPLRREARRVDDTAAWLG